MSYAEYLKQLCKFVLSSSIVLGAIVGIANLIARESTADVDLEIDIGGFGGLWLIPALPLVSMLVFVLLSPLSFWIHKLMSRKTFDN
jgi:hypothetical protein